MQKFLTTLECIKTIAQIVIAKAGLGKPIKYFLSVSSKLNLAKRIAPIITGRALIKAKYKNGSPVDEEKILNINIDGARQKEIKSAKESISLPNFDDKPIRRASLPSNASNAEASIIK